MDKSVISLAEKLGHALLEKGWMATTAESCTGGGIAYAITESSGSSAWFDRAFITYTNEAKMQMLDVSANVLEEQGAVSQAVVEQMVRGSLAHSNAQVAAAVSGVAGPSGGSEAKPVGTVWIAWQLPYTQVKSRRMHFDGDRYEVRLKTISFVFQQLIKELSDS